MPRSVSTAVQVTKVSTLVVGGFTTLLCIGAVVMLELLVDLFGRELQWWALGGGAVVLLLCALGYWTASLVDREGGRARWPLMTLTVIAGVLGVMTSYYVLPLVVSATAVWVLVLLLRGESREWFRSA